jgi:hypothetical protein
MLENRKSKSKCRKKIAGFGSKVKPLLREEEQDKPQNTPDHTLILGRIK